MKVRLRQRVMGTTLALAIRGDCSRWQANARNPIVGGKLTVTP